MNISKRARILITAGAAMASLFGGVLVLAGVDLYLGGHSIRPLGDRPLLDADSLGVHLSVADAILLLVVVLVGVAAALSTRRPAA